MAIANGFRFVTGLLTAVTLTGCVSYSHLESSRELTRLYQDRVNAEVLAFQSLQAMGKPDAPSKVREGLSGGEPVANLAAARRALLVGALKDAADLESASRLESQDRISLIYRAVLKAWHAGNAWERQKDVAPG